MFLRNWELSLLHDFFLLLQAFIKSDVEATSKFICYQVTYWCSQLEYTFFFVFKINQNLSFPLFKKYMNTKNSTVTIFSWKEIVETTTQRSPMLLFVLPGTLFKFKANNPAFVSLFQLPPRKNEDLKEPQPAENIYVSIFLTCNIYKSIIFWTINNIYLTI